MRLARIRPRRQAGPRPAAEPEALLPPEPALAVPVVEARSFAPAFAPDPAPTFALGFPHMTLLTVGAELYLIGDSNTDGSTRLLIVADANGDGLPDARLQWRVAGAWIDVTSLNTVPASSVVRSDGVTAQQAFDSLGAGTGGPVVASSITTSAVPGQTTVEGALGAHQTAISLKADASATTASLALKADASATTASLALKADASATTASLVLKQDATPAADINANSHKVINLSTPVSSTDAANKNYVDSVAQGQSPKDAVRAGTTANITLSGTQTIDTVAVIAGDRVLVKNQTTQSQNGIYVAAAGAWARAVDMDTWLEVPGASTLVTAGGQAGTLWVCNSVAGGTLGTTAITFVQVSSASLVTSVLGRTGAVIATTGDYADSQISAPTSSTNLGTLAANARAWLAAIDVALGGNVKALFGLTGAADTVGYFTGAAAMATTALTSFGRAIIGAANALGVATQLGSTGDGTKAWFGDGSWKVPSAGSGGLTSITATSLQSGAPASTLGASEAQIGSQVTITPKSSSSKIRITARVDVTKDNSATARVATVRLRRGAAVTGVQVGQDCLVSSATALANFGPLVLNFVDAPGSTAAQTYTLSGLCGTAAVVTVARYELTAEELLAGGFDLTSPAAQLGGVSGEASRATTARNLDRPLLTDFGVTTASTAAAVATALAAGLAASPSGCLVVPFGTFAIASVTIPAGKVLLVEGTLAPVAGQVVTVDGRLEHFGNGIGGAGSIQKGAGLIVDLSATGAGSSGLTADPTIRTGTFTSVANFWYRTSTKAAAFTGNLPAAPPDGSLVEFYDVDNTWGLNPFTAARNGATIRGTAADVGFPFSSAGVRFIYSSGAGDWDYVLLPGAASALSGALLAASNGADIPDPSAFRDNIGLGDLAVRDFVVAPATKFLNGKPTTGQRIMGFVLDAAITIPTLWAGFVVRSFVGATLDTHFEVRRNGSYMGDLWIFAGGTSGFITALPETAAAAGDTIEVVLVTTVDSTLADIWLSFPRSPA